MVPLASSIEAAGLRRATVEAKRAAFLAATRALRGQTGESSVDGAFVVPGRIEVLGKHTDYAGGRSLLCAAEQGFCVVVRARSDAAVHVIDVASGESIETALDPALEPVRGHWGHYPATVARRVARNFPGARLGADIALSSDLPRASGMSSSSALMIAAFLAIAHVNHLAQDPSFQSAIASSEDLAGYLATIENGNGFGTLAGDVGVGTFGGSEDHTAILCCRPDALSQYRFAPVQPEREIEWPAGMSFVIAVSGVVAEKTGAALGRYNRASRSAARVLEAWRHATGRSDPTLGRAIRDSPDGLAQMRAVLASAGDQDFSAAMLRDRFEQFRVESEEIIPAASAALAAGDLPRFGVLVDQSQDAAERWLGNQIAETMWLARHARECGAAAASAFGAGFGGSVWAMVPAEQVAAVIERWSTAYRAAYPEAGARSAFFETRPGPSARQIERAN
ncbi:MAG: galactokinase family protein [Acidobacteriota bacterium]